MGLLDDILKKARSGIQNINPVAENNPIRRGISQAGSQIENTAASIPYAMHNIGRNIRAKTALPVDFNKMHRQFDQQEKRYQNMSPIGQAGFDSIIGQGNRQPIGGQEAQLRPNIINSAPAPKGDPTLEGIKQQVLGESNFRSQAKEYLSKLPISYEKMQGTVLGKAYKANLNPHIAISDEFKSPPTNMYGEDPMTPEQEAVWLKEMKDEQVKQLKTVVEHELLHQTPRLIPEEMYKPENLKKVDAYTKRWGKEYMEAPDALVEEMFAEQDLPPAYYWHIYKKTVQNPSQDGFVANMINYFTKSQGGHEWH